MHPSTIFFSLVSVINTVRSVQVHPAGSESAQTRLPYRLNRGHHHLHRSRYAPLPCSAGTPRCSPGSNGLPRTGHDSDVNVDPRYQISARFSRETCLAQRDRGVPHLYKADFQTTVIKRGGYNTLLTSLRSLQTPQRRVYSLFSPPVRACVE